MKAILSRNQLQVHLSFDYAKYIAKLNLSILVVSKRGTSSSKTMKGEM